MPSTSQYANSSGYGLGAQAVALAARYIGVPYVWGGETPDGFDCSGLVQFVYNKLGIKLPRTSEEQAKIGITVPYSQAQPGDLLLYNYGTPNDHIGIYAGGGQQINAPRPGRGVEQAAVDTKHLTSVVRPFTNGASDAGWNPLDPFGVLPDGTPNPLNGLDALTDAISGGVAAAEKGIARTAIVGTVLLGAVGLVVIGLWRGVSPMKEEL